LDNGSPGSEKSFGMKQRPDGDIEIDEKFWEADYHIPACPKCNGVLKPDVIFSVLVYNFQLLYLWRLLNSDSKTNVFAFLISVTAYVYYN
jgi:hypothetical protein